MAYKIRTPSDDQETEPTFSEQALQTAKRLPGIIGAGAGAAIAGSFSTPAEFANLGARGIMGLAGQKSTPYEQSLISKLFPTTEQHLENIHRGIPSTKPRNEVERFSQDLVKDTLSLYTPGKLLKLGKYAQKPLRSLAISLGANTVGLGTEKFTGDRNKGQLVKNGMMFGLSLLNPTTADTIKKSLYKGAEALLPNTATTSSTHMTQALGNLESKILNGRPRKNVAPSEEFVLQQIDKFKALDNQGNVNISSLVAQKRSLSEELTKALFELPDRTLRARAKNLATEITHISKDTLKQYGHGNPRWWKLQSEADQAASAIYKSNYISRILEKFMKGKPEGFSNLFGIGIPTAVSVVSKLGAGTTTAGYLGTKYATRMIKSPALRKHYAKVIGAAATENIPESKIQKEVDNFEKELNKNSRSKFKIKS